MTPLFRAKCIEPVGDIKVGEEYDVYKIDLSSLTDDVRHYFLILTPHGFRSYRANRFTYETKLEKVMK